MSIRYLIILIAISFIIPACENSSEVNVELPYQEFTVIYAQLSAGKIFDGVTITHTLPLGSQYDIRKTEITNAVAYILVDGAQVVPLHYVVNGLYKPLTSFVIEEGKTYELFAEIGSKSIYSKTTVPAVPNVLDVVNANNEYLSADVNANPGEAYGAVWIIPEGGESSLKADDFHSIETAVHFPSHLLIRTKDIPAPYNTPAYSGYLNIQVYAFDEAYKDYFLTKTAGNPINNTFTSGGGKVSWNVYGENVIGLFIGLAEGSVIHP